MPIPKIIHQTAQNKDIKEPYRSFQGKLLSLHPDWDYYFYDDRDCRNTVAEQFPVLLPIYDSFTTNVQRADMFRVVAVYSHGGVYVDLDAECLQPLDGLCECNCVLSEEKTLTVDEARKLGHEHTLRIANYMFASEPNHLFMLHLLLEMVERCRKPVISEDDVLESTGPGLMTDTYHACKDRLRDIVLLRNMDRVCPAGCGGVSCHFGNYARHYHLGSWRPGKERSLISPGPKRKKLAKEDAKRASGAIKSEVEKRQPDSPPYVLQTYQDIAYDGLSTVFQRCLAIGSPIDDSKRLKDKKVLVVGVPFRYMDRISPSNTNVVYTTFESTELPKSWVQAINDCYQHCIVPHESVQTVFRDSGVKIPIEVVHQGFTRYRRRRRSFSVNRLFRVGFLGVPTRRKNLYKLFEACSSLQTQIPGLKLVVHVPTFYQWLDRSETRIIRSAQFVEWSEGRWTEEKLADWFHDLSCYVFPSSGEGWSFTPRESLYLGVPTIISDIPVHDELVASGFCKVIGSKRLEDAQFEGNNTFGQWHCFDTEDIARAIMDVYKNYGSYSIRSLQGSHWIENKWPNESMQQRVLTFLNGI
ncbi:MAG: glycosyltransferase [Desulfoferrobacter sp.]